MTLAQALARSPLLAGCYRMAICNQAGTRIVAQRYAGAAGCHPDVHLFALGPGAARLTALNRQELAERGDWEPGGLYLGTVAVATELQPEGTRRRDLFGEEVSHG